MVSDAATTCSLVESALALTSDVALRWRALVAQDGALQPGGDRERQRAGLSELELLADAVGTAAARAEVGWRWCYFARTTADHAAALSHGQRTVALGELRFACAAEIELAFLLSDLGRTAEALAPAARSKRSKASFSRSASMVT